MNKKQIVLTILLVMMAGVCFDANAAYMGHTGVVKNEIGINAVKAEVTVFSSSGSNAKKTATDSDAKWLSSASNAEFTEQFSDGEENRILQ